MLLWTVDPLIAITIIKPNKYLYFILAHGNEYSLAGWRSVSMPVRVLYSTHMSKHEYKCFFFVFLLKHKKIWARRGLIKIYYNCRRWFFFTIFLWTPRCWANQEKKITFKPAVFTNAGYACRVILHVVHEHSHRIIRNFKTIFNTLMYYLFNDITNAKVEKITSV